MNVAEFVRSTLLGGAVVALAACAGAASGGGGAAPAAGGGGGLAIEVINDIVPPTTITVWIAPETGGRRRLGTVSPNGQETFNFNAGITSMEHRLVADVSGGQDQTSNPFVIEGLASVQWRASSTVVRTRR